MPRRSFFQRALSSSARKEHRLAKREEAAVASQPASGSTPGEIAARAAVKLAEEKSQQETRARHEADQRFELEKQRADAEAQLRLQAEAKLEQDAKFRQEEQDEQKLKAQYETGGEALARGAIACWLGDDSDSATLVSFNFADISVANRATIFNAALDEARKIVSKLLIVNQAKALALNSMIFRLSENTSAIVSQEIPLVNSANFLLLTGPTPALPPGAPGGVPLNELTSAATIAPHSNMFPASVPTTPNTVVPDDEDYVEVTSTALP